LYKIKNYFKSQVVFIVVDKIVVVSLRHCDRASPFLDFVYVVTVAGPSEMPLVVEEHVQRRSFLHDAKENAEATATNKNIFFMFLILIR
jgi:hypothetical protein